MDPNEAHRHACHHLNKARLASCEFDQRDELEHLRELADYFEALDEWLTKGGFLPDAWRQRPWNDDLVQFPRLLAEIMATQDDLDLLTLADSMDLSVGRVEELFERAHTSWEAIKERGN